MAKNEHLYINWDNIPDILSKEQFCKLCHIAKNTARNLLLTGEVPCQYSGKKTKCFQIKKEDIKAYLERRDNLPRRRVVTTDGKKTVVYEAFTEKHLPTNVKQAMQSFFEEMVRSAPDVLVVENIMNLTGYSPKVINRWCAAGSLKSFKRAQRNHIPKVMLVEFFCSHSFRAFAYKNTWHKWVMQSFANYLDELEQNNNEESDDQ